MILRYKAGDNSCMHLYHKYWLFKSIIWSVHYKSNNINNNIILKTFISVYLCAINFAPNIMHLLIAKQQNVCNFLFREVALLYYLSDHQNVTGNFTRLKINSQLSPTILVSYLLSLIFSFNQKSLRFVCKQI